MFNINNKSKSSVMLLIIFSLLIMFLVVIIPLFLIKIPLDNSDKYYAPEDNLINNIDNNKKFDLSIENKVTVYLTEEKEKRDMSLEEYIYGVVASEMPASFSEEALKAQAVAARTYVVNKKVNGKCSDAKGGDICDSTHCQVYRSKEKILNKWSENSRDDYWNKIKEAVDKTKGEILTYEGDIVKYPQFFAVSWGKTENSIDVFSGDIPYLSSTDSEGEEEPPKFATDIALKLDEFIDIINSNYSDIGLSKENIKNSINIKEKSQAGGIKLITVGNKEIKGTDFRKLINLSSTNFTFDVTDKEIIFHCKGYGHGVGMSQWGANVMSKEGKKYKDILEHYYKGVKIEKINYK